MSLPSRSTSRSSRSPPDLEALKKPRKFWESIKHVVSSTSVTTCTVTQRYGRDVSEKVPPWDLNVCRRRLVEQLYTVARDILLFAYKAQLKDPGARIERSKETSTTNAALSKPRNRYTEDRLQVASLASRTTLKSSPHGLSKVSSETEVLRTSILSNSSASSGSLPRNTRRRRDTLPRP